MKRWIFILVIALSFALSACAGEPAPAAPSTGGEQVVQPEQPAKATVQDITPEEAKERLDSDEAIILVDVRTKEEFDSGHIEGAVLLPVDQIQKNAADMFPDKDAVYFVYCRSGSRSGVATAMMVELGYQNVFDLGGIIDWPYEVVQ